MDDDDFMCDSDIDYDLVSYQYTLCAALRCRDELLIFSHRKSFANACKHGIVCSMLASTDYDF